MKMYTLCLIKRMSFFHVKKKHQLQIQPDVEMSPESVRQYLGVNMHSGKCHL